MVVVSCGCNCFCVQMKERDLVDSWDGHERAGETVDKFSGLQFIKIPLGCCAPSSSSPASSLDALGVSCRHSHRMRSLTCFRLIKFRHINLFLSSYVAVRSQMECLSLPCQLSIHWTLGHSDRSMDCRSFCDSRRLSDWANYLEIISD